MRVVDPADLQPGVTIFTEFDKDGFPFCPCCGSPNIVSELEVSGTSRKSETRAYLHVLSGITCRRCAFTLKAGYYMQHPVSVL